METPDVTPDPKRSSKRIVDPPAVQRGKLRYPWCAACGSGPGDGLNGHHVLPKGQGGDDVEANIVCLCGSGTSGCHGAHHGNPYEVRRAWVADDLWFERRDAEWVNRRVGQALLAGRPDTIAYVLGKLGDSAGRDWLARTYYLPAR